jgi:hypothetical protein
MEGCAVLRFSGRAALAFGWERPLGRFFLLPAGASDDYSGRALRPRGARPAN